jgi:hypothetical protein
MRKQLSAALVGVAAAVALTVGCGSAAAKTDSSVCDKVGATYRSIQSQFGYVMAGETYLNLVNQFNEDDDLVKNSISKYCPQYQRFVTNAFTRASGIE